jgi:hypothetical protein
MSYSKNSINLKKNKVLFNAPITKEVIEQLVISLALTCHGSERGIVQLLQDVFDYKISIGTVHNILMSAMIRAQEINEQMDLSAIKKGAHDEIFQGTTPILVGSCAETGFCYLLSQENSRDGTTWGVRLLELQENGLQPDHTIADGGTGLRAGQFEAFPDVPCYGDVFHALQDFGRLLIYQENRTMAQIEQVYSLEKKMTRAKKNNQGNKLSKKLGSARADLEKNLTITDRLITLNQWMREDILALTDPHLEERRMLFNFVVQELENTEPLGTKHISKVRNKLQNQRDDLLMFVDEIDQKLIVVAKNFDVDLSVIHAAYQLETIPHENMNRHSEEKKIRDQLRDRFYNISKAIKDVIGSVIRASSIIENLNSRLRNYFFLRKKFSQSSLDLLRFFLNHKTFMRSEHSDRVGKSPTELLYGKIHDHWLELLGYTRFKQAVA